MRLEQKQLLKELARSSHGQALKEYLNEKRLEIGSVQNCTSWEDTLARKHTLDLLDDIFAFLGEEKIIEKPPHQYT